MGGVMILGSVIITSLFYVKDYPKIIPVLFLTVGFGLIGFLDDYLKVVMKRSDGLLSNAENGTADCSQLFCILCCKSGESTAYDADSVLMGNTGTLESLQFRFFLFAVLGYG